MGGVLFAVTGAVAAVLCGMVLAGQSAGLVAASLLLFFTGAAVAGIFVIGARGDASRQQQAASEIYAADLIGGCFGAVAASLWLIPFMGMLPTALVMVGLSLAAAALMKS